MLAGNNLGKEGHVYHHAKNMKLRTGIVEEALAHNNANQDKSSIHVKEGHLWKTRPEILHSMPIDIRTSWKKSHALKNSFGSLNKSCRVDGYRDVLAAVTAPSTVRATRQDLSMSIDRIMP